VKPASYPRALLFAAACSFLLAACGQRGPLYLPAKPAPLSTAPLSTAPLPAAPMPPAPLPPAPLSPAPQPAVPAAGSSDSGNAATPGTDPNSSK